MPTETCSVCGHEYPHVRLYAHQKPERDDTIVVCRDPECSCIDTFGHLEMSRLSSAANGGNENGV